MIITSMPRAAILLACLTALLAAPAVAHAGTTCPSVVNGRAFAGAGELQRLVKAENRFGERYLASRAHDRTIGWIKDEIGAIDGFRIRSDRYRLWRWLPRTKAKGRPGLDLARAGGLTVTSNGATKKVPVAGAVRWSKPTGKQGQTGQLVYLGPDQEITAQNSAGKVVIREFPANSLPYAALQAIGLYITPDLASATGNYERPFINSQHAELLAASAAGAAGVVFTFGVPRTQVKGYGDPHDGTIYKVPGVFVGGAEGRRLRSLATQGASAGVVVRAKVDRATTTNVIATLPGKSRQKIALGTNTDGQSWVQENGVAGLIAFARYYAGLPKHVARGRWRSRSPAPTMRSSRRWTPTRDVWMPSTTREAWRSPLPSSIWAPARSCRTPPATGFGSPARASRSCSPPGTATFCAGRRSSVTKRRKLDRTAVLQGLGFPVAGQVPPICSMSGLGTFFDAAW